MQTASAQVPPASNAAAAIAASVHLDANTLAKRIRASEHQHLKDTQAAIAKRQARASGSTKDTSAENTAENSSAENTSAEVNSAKLINKLFSEE